MNKQHKISYDYYGDTRDIFSIIKDSEWAVFLSDRKGSDFAGGGLG